MAIQRKSLVVKWLGWRRIVKNTARFGWQLSDAAKHTEITETTSYTGKVYENGDVEIQEHVDTSSKVTIHLSFFRNTLWFSNLSAIYPLEIIYNIFFTLRRIAAFFLPFSIGVFFLVGVLFGMEDSVGWTGVVMFSVLCTWLFSIFLETILARIAEGILRERGADDVCEEPQSKTQKASKPDTAAQQPEKAKLPLLKRILYVPVFWFCTLLGTLFGITLTDGSSDAAVVLLAALCILILSLYRTVSQVNGKNSYKLYNPAYFILLCAIKVVVGFACGFFSFFA